MACLVKRQIDEMNKRAYGIKVLNGGQDNPETTDQYDEKHDNPANEKQGVYFLIDMEEDCFEKISFSFIKAYGSCALYGTVPAGILLPHRDLILFAHVLFKDNAATQAFRVIICLFKRTFRAYHAAFKLPQNIYTVSLESPGTHLFSSEYALEYIRGILGIGDMPEISTYYPSGFLKEFAD